VPVFNPIHINDSTITPSDDTSITRKKAHELSEFRLKEGDVVIARRGEMGRCAVVGERESGWLCGTGSMILRPTSSLLAHYLQMYLSSPSTVTALEADAVGSTMVNLNQTILLSLAIPMPPVDEQTEVILRVHNSFERIGHLAAEARCAHSLLDRLDQATLAKAFRGELVTSGEDVT
jgi:type I restriction enzyme S subunit